MSTTRHCAAILAFDFRNWHKPAVRGWAEHVRSARVFQTSTCSALNRHLRPTRMIPHKLLVQHGAGRTTADYRKNQNIFVQGQVADTVFIQKGRVKVTVMSEHGKERSSLYSTKAIFGEGCLSEQPLRTSLTSAMTHCQNNRHNKVSDACGNPRPTKILNLFMDHLLSRNSRIQADVVDQLFNSSEKRLSRLLLLLANYGKEGSPPIAPVTVSQETLAQMIGTTRSRANQASSIATGRSRFTNSC